MPHRPKGMDARQGGNKHSRLPGWQTTPAAGEMCRADKVRFGPCRFCQKCLRNDVCDWCLNPCENSRFKTADSSRTFDTRNGPSVHSAKFIGLVFLVIWVILQKSCLFSENLQPQDVVSSPPNYLCDILRILGIWFRCSFVFLSMFLCTLAYQMWSVHLSTTERIVRLSIATDRPMVVVLTFGFASLR